MSNWISVKDRLPAKNDDVFIRYTLECHHCGNYMPEVYTAIGYYDHFEDEWNLSEAEGLDVNYENKDRPIVTHWQPLPELPEEDEE